MVDRTGGVGHVRDVTSWLLRGAGLCEAWSYPGVEVHS